MRKVTAATDIGRVRRRNEDSYALLPHDAYIVADGMGGHVAGEIASRTAVDTVRELLKGDGAEEELCRVICEANRRIWRLAKSYPEYAGMGTTVTILRLKGSRAFWAHVGDSRLYLLREGRLQQITTDHSLVASLLAKGSITPEEAEHHPQKNVLLRAVGVDAGVQVDSGSFDVRPEDSFLLCSDGLTNMVPQDRICQCLMDGQGRDKAKELVEQTLAAGGTDNVTAIVVERDA